MKCPNLRTNYRSTRQTCCSNLNSLFKIYILVVLINDFPFFWLLGWECYVEYMFSRFRFMGHDHVIVVVVVQNDFHAFDLFDYKNSCCIPFAYTFVKPSTFLWILILPLICSQRLCDWKYWYIIMDCLQEWCPKLLWQCPPRWCASAQFIRFYFVFIFLNYRIVC